jgi:hypothetical protein
MIVFSWYDKGESNNSPLFTAFIKNTGKVDFNNFYEMIKYIKNETKI